MKWSDLNIRKYWLGYISYVICSIGVSIFLIFVLIGLSIICIIYGIYYTILELIGKRELHDK